MPDPTKPVPTWKRVVAGVLDFISAFFTLGYVIGWATGGLTPTGFRIVGLPALVMFAAIIAYFVIGRRYAGGTLWDRFFGIPRP